MKTLNRTAIVLLFTLASGTGFYAFGWDNPGHMAVAGIAYDALSNQQKTRLVALIRQHPALSLITDGFPNGNPSDRELVMAAATWPDLAKRSPDFQNNGYEANDPAVTSVTFDHKQHRGWHFIDTPLWVGNGPALTLPPVPKVNAVGVVNVLVSQLKTSESDDTKAYDLAWLMHLVGDLHQPLHAATGVTETYPKGDTGGNDVLLDGVTHSESELHAYWDDILGKTAHADPHTHHPRLDKDIATATDIVSEVLSTSLGSDPGNLDPSVWAAESFHIARQDVYAIDFQIIHGDRKDKLRAPLDTSYSQTATRDAKKRIHLAGHRLGLLLQQVLQ